MRPGRKLEVEGINSRDIAEALGQRVGLDGVGGRRARSQSSWPEPSDGHRHELVDALTRRQRHLREPLQDRSGKQMEEDRADERLKGKRVGASA